MCQYPVRVKKQGRRCNFDGKAIGLPGTKSCPYAQASLRLYAVGKTLGFRQILYWFQPV